jgi:hypothetical protein
MEIYNAIAAVAGELAQRGISKDSRNAAQGFNFRGIDSVYNALAPLLAKHKLVILPRCVDRTCVERMNSKGTALFYVTIKAEFDLVASDGSKHTIATYGEAMDSGDKATNKAMSAAYKYAAFQAFCIPTEETATDADSETHEVQAQGLSAKEMDDIGLAIHECADIDGLTRIYRSAAPKATELQRKTLTELCANQKAYLTKKLTEKVEA